MDVKSVLKKMRHKDEYNSVGVNVPDEMSDLTNEFVKGDGETDFTLLFIRDKDELDKMFKKTMEKSKYDGLFWLAYPKQSSKIKTDVNRDTIWEDLKPLGFRPVSMVSLDKTWSAMRVRPSAEVG